MLSQCIQAQKSDGLCNTCFKQKQSDGKTKCGTVDDRIACDEAGTTFKNPETGKEPIKFGVFMAKQNITREQAIAEAEKFGVVIPESEFEVPQKRKGRPPSEKPVSKGDLALQEAIKKAVAAVSSSESEGDHESNLNAPSPKNTPPAVPMTNEDHYNADTDHEDDDTVDVKPFVHDGKNYLRDGNNMMYDTETHEVVGVWNEAEKTITPCETVSDDEEEDDN
jgi:hypothetical protein